MRRHSREHGFSLIEMTVAMGLMLVVTASIFSLVNPGQGSFVAEPEVADMQQRTRVAQDTLFKDLVMAGSGSYSGTNPMALSYFFAPVMPFRQGRLLDDPPGTFRTDTITLMLVPATTAQTSIAQDMPAQSAELKVKADPGCPAQGSQLCGFKEGMTVLIYDEEGSYDTFTITQVQDPALHLQHNLEDLSKKYAEGSKIVQIQSHTYYLKTDVASKTFQLMHYDGGGNDVPIVDNVVGLEFEYFGDPQPPIMNGKPFSVKPGPWTTYGPKPKDLASSNCVFINDGSPIHAPRLPVLGPGGLTTTLVKLTQQQLTDGPWCPDDNNPNRFDADLFRIRKVGVRIRLQTGNDSLRGPASALFTYGGTSRGGNKYLPDQEVRFQVTPRNLNLGR